MSNCSSCGAAGSCNCSTVTIPTGQDGEDGSDGISPEVVAEAAGANCVYGGVKITDAAGNITYVCNGAPGSNGSAGTMAKYANTFTVTSAVILDITVISPILISKAAIIVCNPLVSTCASTPTDFDFSISIWYQSASSQWLEVTNTASYIKSISYDTSANYLLISPATTGVFRVVIMG